ncbi:MAG: hypothetical protein RSC93_00200 [Erysipelotrichaceae bacterium]
MNVITLSENFSDDQTYSYDEVLVYFDDIPEPEDLEEYFNNRNIGIDEIGIGQIINNIGDFVSYYADDTERRYKIDVIEVTKINKKK